MGFASVLRRLVTGYETFEPDEEDTEDIQCGNCGNDGPPVTQYRQGAWKFEFRCPYCGSRM